MEATDKDVDFQRPGFSVSALPFLHFRQVYGDQSKKAPVRRLHPVLAVRLTDGSVIVPDETLMWARYKAGANSVSQSSPERPT